MEIDTGSSYSMISFQRFNQLLENSAPTLKEVKGIPLIDYQGNAIPLEGYRDVEVTHKQNNAKMQLIVTKEPHASLLGYHWFPALGLEIVGTH